MKVIPENQSNLIKRHKLTDLTDQPQVRINSNTYRHQQPLNTIIYKQLENTVVEKTPLTIEKKRQKMIKVPKNKQERYEDPEKHKNRLKQIEGQFL